MMGIYGMTDIERQILLNQSVIMGFLHGAFLDRISALNENSFGSLSTCYQMTRGMLEADMKLKEGRLNREADND